MSRKSKRTATGERLQKVLAGAGLGSRRKVVALIEAGLVKVDGVIVRERGARVDLRHQTILCDGRPVREPRKITLILNKPRNVITSSRDDRGRRTVMHYVRHIRERLYPVGRLDWDSQGLILMTNDGDLANLLTHPRYGVPRTYHVMVKGSLGSEVLGKLHRGVWLSEGKTGPVRSRVKKRSREGAVLEVTVREGMNREVRRVFARFGLRVKRLKRVRVGPISLGSLAPGSTRVLTDSEVRALRESARPSAPARKAAR